MLVCLRALVYQVQYVAGDDRGTHAYLCLMLVSFFLA